MQDIGIKDRIRKRVMDDIDIGASLRDEDISSIIDRCLMEETKDTYIPLKEKIQLRREMFNQIRRLDILTEYLENDDVSDVMINGMNTIYIERHGHLIKTGKVFESDSKLNTVIQQIVAGCNRRVNEAEPIVDARLPDGSRVNIVLPPVSMDGPIVTIRKFPKRTIDMKRLIELGSLSEEVAYLLEQMVKAKYNIFISGGTGSGKTTFLNALSDFIPKTERIITIEDSAELRLNGVDNLVRLEARNANVEGKNEITIRDLIKTSLRMRPDRIIVGEVRDAAAIDMLTAMNTGHDGSLSTGHANSAVDMIARLETMVLTGMDIPMAAVRSQIASAIDIMIHLGRMRDGSRRVINISEVSGMEENEVKLNTLFEFVETGSEFGGRVSGVLNKVNQLENTNKLISAGLFNVYQSAWGKV